MEATSKSDQVKRCFAFALLGLDLPLKVIALTLAIRGAGTHSLLILSWILTLALFVLAMLVLRGKQSRIDPKTRLPLVRSTGWRVVLGLMVLASFLTSGYLSFREIRPKRLSATIVLFRMDSPSEPQLRFTERIAEELRESTAGLEDVSIRIVERSLPLDASSSDLLAIARRHRAKMVAGGWYIHSGDAVQVHLRAFLRPDAAGYSAPPSPEKWHSYVRFEDVFGATQRFSVHDGLAEASAAVGLYLLGYAAFGLNQLEEAVTLLSRAAAQYSSGLQATGYLTNVLYWQAAALVRLQRWEEALPILNQAIVQGCHEPWLYAHRGRARQLLGDARGASEDFATALRDMPTSAILQFSQGEVLAVLGEWEQALFHFNQAIVNSPQDAGFLLARGNTRQVIGDLVGAIDDFTISMELETCPDGRLMALKNRANAYSQLGQASLAANDYWELAENAAASLQLLEAAEGISRLRLFDDALGLFERLLWLSEEESVSFKARVHEGRGLALAGKGQRDAAIASLLTAVDLEPTSASLATLGLMRHHRGDCPQGLADLERAVEIDPRHPQVLANLGMVLLEHDRAMEAIAILTRALEALDAQAARFDERSRVLSWPPVVGHSEVRNLQAFLYSHRAAAAANAGNWLLAHQDATAYRALCEHDLCLEAAEHWIASLPVLE